MVGIYSGIDHLLYIKFSSSFFSLSLSFSSIYSWILIIDMKTSQNYLRINVKKKMNINNFFAMVITCLFFSFLTLDSIRTQHSDCNSNNIIAALFSYCNRLTKMMMIMLVCLSSFLLLLFPITSKYIMIVPMKNKRRKAKKLL